MASQMRKNLAAHTSSVFTGYPSFFSVNTVEGSDDVEIILRSPETSEGRCGDTSSMKMSAADFRKVVAELFVHVTSN